MYHHLLSLVTYLVFNVFDDLIIFKRYFASQFLNNMLLFAPLIFKSNSLVALFQGSPSILEQVCESLKSTNVAIGGF